jgi:hypothetical protein
MTHARIEFREKIICTGHGSNARIRANAEFHTANPTRVAIDELQLQDLKNIDAADG